ncbi:SRPBCC family protein [Terriglobus aquaticus]|uniref:SRPBCC family protein n=1 Tax=Terriglobus aquaticus TaxID=940139 RepID=A0ABW9KNT1_9BACT|nr:SRPBCC family protein [Terriglobus aquaticus]
MPTETLQEVRFPRTGNAYTPLPNDSEGNRLRAHAVATINASPEEVYNTYASIDLLPIWQEGVVSVTRIGGNKLHWVMQDPGTGVQTEFDAEELELVPGKRHVSRVLTGPTAGTTDILSLEPHPAGRGTVATMIVDGTVPGGAIANAVAGVISRSPRQLVIEDLRHLKELIESSQIPSVEGQPAGRRGISGKLKQLLMGENLPTPPGTSDRAHPQDLPRKNRFIGKLSPDTLTTVGLATIPVVLGVILWASLSDND